MRPNRRRTDPERIPWAFRYLLVGTIALEAAYLLWRAGFFRPLA